MSSLRVKFWASNSKTGGSNPSLPVNLWWYNIIGNVWTCKVYKYRFESGFHLMKSNKYLSTIPTWITLSLQENLYFSEICSIINNDNWKEFRLDTWYGHWNSYLSKQNAPFYIKSWEFSIDQTVISWEIRLRFHKWQDQNNVFYYKQFIQLLPIWWYLFFLHPKSIHVLPDYPFKFRESFLEIPIEDKTYRLKRSLVSFFKHLFIFFKITLTLHYQFTARKGWGTIQINSDHSLQDYLNNNWGDFDSDMTYPSEILTKDHIIHEWRNSPEVRSAVQRLKEEIVDSSEGQLLQELLDRNPDLRFSFQKALALQSRRLKAARSLRDQVFKGNIYILEPQV